MRLSLIRIAVLCTTVALLATTAHAVQPDKPDYGRPGWYAGVGAGAGWDFLEGAISDATRGAVEIGTAGTFNARGGYRVTSWFAIEGMYEGVYDLTGTLDGQLDFAKSSNHSFLANFKLIAPIWRMHPYLAIGPGAQYGQFDDILGALDRDRWDFVLRLGLGLDAYVTENWLVNLEIAPSIRFTDYNNIPSQSTDNVSLTFSGGVQYRF
jgi:opacity protein-like surface antigen